MKSSANNSMVSGNWYDIIVELLGLFKFLLAETRAANLKKSSISSLKTRVDLIATLLNLMQNGLSFRLSSALFNLNDKH